MNIEKVTILLRVKNSTAFATDNEFDCNKRWIVSPWCGGGTGMRTGQASHGMARTNVLMRWTVCENREKWDSLNRFVWDFVCVRRELEHARARYKMSPIVDIAVPRKGVRECSRNKPSGEMLAHDPYFQMLSSEFHDSVIIQWFSVPLAKAPIP